MHKKLFIPGPVDVRPDVLAKLSEPMISHRGKAVTALQQGISEKLQKLFYTGNTIVLSTTSGSGLMESAVKCCTAKRAAVFSVGAFGDRWFDMAEKNGVPADKFRAEDGKATCPDEVDKALATGKYDVVTITHNETSSGLMNPVEDIAAVIRKYPDVVFCLDAVSSMGGTKIEVDKLGVDFCITSTQKCLGLPPGMAIAAVSEKAIERAKTVPNRGIYLDIVTLVDYVKKNFQYPSTPSLPHMFALDYQLGLIMQEGQENRYARHREMAAHVRAWAQKHFALFADEKHLSNTLTTIKNTKGISVAELNSELGKRGYEISNGYGKLKELTFRISHMADMTLKDVQDVTAQIDDILGLK